MYFKHSDLCKKSDFIVIHLIQKQEVDERGICALPHGLLGHSAVLHRSSITYLP